MAASPFPSDRVPKLMEFARIAGAAQDVESLRAGTLSLIRRIFRSDSTIFWLINPDFSISSPLEVNVPKHFFPMYSDYYHRLNPFDPINMGSFRGTALSMEQVVPYKEFKKTEYFNDFIRPQRIRRQMVVYIHVQDALTSVICTHRSRDIRFGKEDLAAGDMVSSHLSTAFERIQVVEKIRRKGSFFQMILDSTDIGIAVLDLDKRVLFINRKAVEICTGIKMEPVSEGRHRRVDSALPWPVLKDCDAVKRHDETGGGEDLGPIPVKERVLWVSDSERCRFRSRLADETLTDFSRPLFLVTMEVLPAHPGVDEDVMRRGLHLTKREAEIVSYIFRGHRNAEIADRLFISEGTVKNHLRSIYEKAQVKNRTGLIHKVLTLGQPGLRASRTLRERL